MFSLEKENANYNRASLEELLALDLSFGEEKGPSEEKPYDGPDFVEVKDIEPEDNSGRLSHLMETAFEKRRIGGEEKTTLVDGVFAELYILVNNIIFSNGAFYTPQGMVSVGAINHEVSMSIYDKVPTNLAANTKKVVDAMKSFAYKNDFTMAGKMIIPFKNGDMKVKEKGKWVFERGRKRPVPYRLPVDFVGMSKKIPTPNFDKWLHDLFTEEDIITLQEYLGYCFIPSTRAQMALFLIGEGGVGKSVLGKILVSLFGTSVTSPDDTVSFLEDKFKTAELENQLVFYEDDLNDKKLNDCGKLKKLITNDLEITADRKYENAFKFQPYCRFIMCGNAMLQAPNDKSDGFYRRLLPLQVKPKDPKRENIPCFGDIVAQEAEGIVQWAMVGLKRLIENHYEFTESDRTKTYKENYRNISDHFPLFFKDCFVQDEEGDVTYSEVSFAYDVWCTRNAFKKQSDKVLRDWLFNNTEKYGIKIDSNGGIRRGDKRSRGYKGIKLSPEYDAVSIEL